MSATFSLVAPIGPGNWPATAALVNLTQHERDKYQKELDAANLIIAISQSLPGYRGPTKFGQARWRQILPLYNAQRGTINRRLAKNWLSVQSVWCHAKKNMLLLIDQHSGLGGPVQPPAPGPVVGHQQQHIPLQQPAQRTPLPSSRPNSAEGEGEEEDEDESEEDEDENEDENEDEDEDDDEMEEVEEENDGGEEADLRLMGVFGFSQN